MEDVIKTVIKTTLNWEDYTILNKSPLKDGKDWDSVNQLRVLMALESELNVKVSIKKFINCANVSEIANLINVAQ